MRTNAIQNTGNPQEITEWVDTLTRSGLFKMPTGDYAPMIARNDGTINLMDPEDGTYLDTVPVGGWIILSFGGYMRLKDATGDAPERR